MSGLRANLSRGLVFNDDGDLKKLDEGVEFYRSWHGKGEGRIHVDLAPMHPTPVHRSTLSISGKVPKNWGLPYIPIFPKAERRLKQSTACMVLLP